MAEIGNLDLLPADKPAQRAHLGMRQGEKGVEEPQLMHHFERRGVDRVAAEVAQKVAVLFHHRDIDPGARQEKPEHHPGRTAAGNGAGHAIGAIHP